MASLSPGGTVAIGVIVGLISTCVQSVGLTLQRKSHILEEEKEEHLPRRAPYRRRRWQIGMFLFLLSNIVGSTIQITTLPLPLLSTLQASGLVFNALLASLLLHEPFTRRTALGTILVAAGAVLISFFSAVPEPSHTLDQLLGLLVKRTFLIWFTLTLLLVVGVLVGTFAISHILPLHRRRGPRARLLKGMSYGMISGILSAHALLLAKSAVELLVRTIVDKKNQFNRYQSWLLLLLFLFLALSQLYYLHHGLKLVSTSILYPFVFCIYNIIAILDGLIYFRQTDLLSPLQGGLIGLGTAILLIGVLALSWRLSEDPNTASDDPDSPVHERIKVDLPHTALTPGMGLVDERANDVQTPLHTYFDDPEEEDSDSVSPFPTRYRDDPSNEAQDGTVDHLNASASERDPLLLRRRPTTSSSRKRNSIDRRAAVQRRRRSTIKEVQAVWDELRDERNWFPPAQRSPLRSRGGDGKSSAEGSPQLDRYRDEEAAGEGSPRPPRSAGAELERGGRAVGSGRRREKRKTAPPGTFTFSGVMNALSGSKQEGSAGRGVKRTVSWGQVRPDASRGSQVDLLGDEEAVDEEPARPTAPEEDGEGPKGDEEGKRGRDERERVPSVGSPSGASSAETGGEEAAQRKSWTGSVKLDWWRKRRRDDGGK